MTAKYPIVVNIGATFRVVVTRKVDGVPVEATTSQWRINLRDDIRSQNFRWDLDTVSTSVIFEIGDDITSQLQPHRHYYYRLERIEDTGDVIRMLEGKVTAHG